MDWSDGPDSASSALGQFKIETPLDQEIYDNIAQILKKYGF